MDMVSTQHATVDEIVRKPEGEIATWPALKHSPEAAVKERLVTVINARASRGDPAHMQAAIRHLATEAAWPAHGWRPTATVVLEPDWIPIV